MDQLIAKFDHKNTDKITWTEFLNFLSNEGVRREVVNDAQLYGFGVKRLQEMERINLKQQEDKVVEYYIDCLVYIQCKHFRLILALFENNVAKVLDAGTFNVIQELKFPSDYAIAKNVKELEEGKKQQKEVIKKKKLQQYANDYESKYAYAKHPNPFKENRSLSSIDKRIQRHEEIKREIMGRESLDCANDIINRSSLPIRPQTQMSAHKNSKPARSKYSSAVKTISHADNSTILDDRPYGELSQLSGVARAKAKNDKTLSDDAIKLQVLNFKIWLDNMNKKMIRKKLKDEEQIRQMKKAKIDSSKNGTDINPYGILGLTKLIEDEGSIGSFSNYGGNEKQLNIKYPVSLKLTKEEEKLKSEFYKKVNGVKRQVQQRDDLNETIFAKLIDEQRQEFKQQQEKLKQKVQQLEIKLKEEEEVNLPPTKLAYTRQLIYEYSQDLRKPFDEYKASARILEKFHMFSQKEQEEKVKEIVRRKVELDKEENRAWEMVDGLNNKVTTQKAKFNNLEKINRYFYKQVSPSPQQIAQEQDERARAKKKTGNSAPDIVKQSGQDENDEQVNKNYCTPEMITEFVKELREQGKERGEDADKDKAKGDSLFELNRKNKIKHTKAVYTVAANYNEEQGILALALIDKEIKIYHVKQDGTRIRLVESFSFEAKFRVSCLHIDRLAMDDRPIICIGGHKGDVSVYYLDEKVIDKETGKPDPSKRTKKHKITFNFFDRGPAKGDQKESHSFNNSQNNDEKLNQSVSKQLMQDSVQEEQSSTKKSTKIAEAKQNLNEFLDDDILSEEVEQPPLAKNPMAMMHPDPELVKNEDYWEIMMHTRKSKDPSENKFKSLSSTDPNGGTSKKPLDGIQIWNKVTAKLQYQESAICLAKLLLDKDWDIDVAIDRWIGIVNSNLGDYEVSVNQFLNEMNQIAYMKGLSNNEALQLFEQKNKNRNSELFFDRRQKGSFTKSESRVNSVMKKGSVQTSMGVASTGVGQVDISNKNSKGRVTSMTVKSSKKSILGNSTNSAQNNAGQRSNSKTSKIAASKKESLVSRGAFTSVKEEEQNTVNNQNYLHQKKKVNEITDIRYVRDIGLIATAFNGTIKIFDAFNFHQLWKNQNKHRSVQQHTNIATFDVSPTLGLMATGGAEGKLVLIDPYALGVINAVEAHKNQEILHVFIYNEQQQIFTVALDRSIIVWDAYRLDRIQVIKDVSLQHTPKFTSSVFDYQNGILYTGCQSLIAWKAEVDSKVEINALQVQTLSKNIMKERNMLDHLNFGGSQRTSMASSDAKTGKVLVSNQSSLVDVAINEMDYSHFLLTVDSENLLRGWSIKSNSTVFSYKIPMKKRVTAIAVDNTCTKLAVGNTIGEVKVLNLKSGGVLYNLPHQDKEITTLKFLSGMSEFWLIGGCWQGKMVMWTAPSEENNFQITGKCRIGHKGDVLAIDSSNQYIVSGGVDGLVSVWNTFSGVLKYAVQLPDPEVEQIQGVDYMKESDKKQNDRKKTLKALKIRRTIVGLKFHPYFTNLVCVLQEGGNIHMVDASNGTVANDFVAYAKINSNWACDEENQTMLIVGDVGKAALFDISMGSKSLPMKKVGSTRAPQFVKRGENTKWKMKMPWFTAHKIAKMDPAYVVSAKFSARFRIFVTGTSHGEVILWSADQLVSLGIINQPNHSLNDQKANMLDYIESVLEQREDKEYDNSDKQD